MYAVLVNHAALQDYILALRAERDGHYSHGNQNEGAMYQRYIDAIELPISCIRRNKWPSLSDLEPSYRDLLGATSPYLIERLVFHRRSEVYRAVMRLAGVVERVRSGKPAKRFFGLL